MEPNNISNRRRRRSVKEIEDAVFAATEKLVVEKGFNNVAFTEIMKLADVEPQVMYRRFPSHEDLYDKFIRQHDYWLHDVIEHSLDNNNPEMSMKNILKNLAISLYDNPIMQQILIWEVSEHNKLTKRTAVNREMNTLPILSFFRESLPTEVDFDCFTSILIGGIYYLIIRRERSLFCGIDFDEDNGKALLIDTVVKLIDKVYTKEEHKENTEAIEIAKRLLEQGVDESIIATATKLSEEEIRVLKQ